MLIRLLLLLLFLAYTLAPSLAYSADPICGVAFEVSFTTPQTGAIQSCRAFGTHGIEAFEEIWLDPVGVVDLLPLYSRLNPPLDFNVTCTSTFNLVSEAADPAGRCLPPSRPLIILPTQ